MPYLVAAVVALALLALIQLLFTLAIVRRVREQGERLARFEAPDQLPAPAGPGEIIGAFTATTITGVLISDADLRDGPTMVGFFSPSCGPCADQLPFFEERARRLAGSHGVLAFVIDEGESSWAEATRLAKVATAAVIAADTSVTRAFSVYGYPVILDVDTEARVVASGHAVEALPQMTPAP
jgi:thiol-disulfide isomerase/thioredoxin